MCAGLMEDHRDKIRNLLCFSIIFCFLVEVAFCSNFSSHGTSMTETGSVKKDEEVAQYQQRRLPKTWALNEAHEFEGELFARTRRKKQYVDKSEFIKFFMHQSNDFIYLSAPPRFGKSVNMNMLKLYLGAPLVSDKIILERKKKQVTELFENLAISADTSFHGKHFQKYTVVLFDFTPLVRVTDYESFKSAFASLWCRTLLIELMYVEYVEDFVKEPIPDPSSPDSHLKCTAYVEKNFDKISANLGQSLAKSLKRDFKRPVIFLFDEYDSFLQALVDGEVKDVDKITTSTGVFMHHSIKDFSEVLKGLCVGSLSLGGVISKFANNIKHVRFNRDKNFAKYFGFTLEEVKALLGNFSLSAHLHYVRKWYGGFTVIDNPDVTLFNPISISEYVETGNFDFYWVKTIKNLHPQFSPFFSHPQIGREIERIFFDRSAAFEDSIIPPGFKSFQKIREKVNKKNPVTLERSEISLFIQFLSENGYFTEISESAVSSNSVRLKITNFEMRALIDHYLFSSKFYENVLHFTESQENKLITAFQQLFYDDKSFERLAKNLHELFAPACDSVNLEEVTLSGSIFRILRRFDDTYKANFQEVRCVVPVSRGDGSDVDAVLDFLILRRDNIVIVIEAKRHRSSLQAWREVAIEKANLNTCEREYPKLKIVDVFYVGLNIDRKCGFQISYSFESKNRTNPKTVSFPRRKGQMTKKPKTNV